MGDLSKIIGKIKGVNDEVKEINDRLHADSEKRTEKEKPERDEIYAKIIALQEAIKTTYFGPNLFDSKIFWIGKDPNRRDGAAVWLKLYVEPGSNKIKVRHGYPYQDISPYFTDYWQLELDQLKALDKRLPKFAEKILEIKEKKLERYRRETKAKSIWQFWK